MNCTTHSKLHLSIQHQPFHLRLLHLAPSSLAPYCLINPFPALPFFPGFCSFQVHLYSYQIKFINMSGWAITHHLQPCLQFMQNTFKQLLSNINNVHLKVSSLAQRFCCNLSCLPWVWYRNHWSHYWCTQALFWWTIHHVTGREGHGPKWSQITTYKALFHYILDVLTCMFDTLKSDNLICIFDNLTLKFWLVLLIFWLQHFIFILEKMTKCIEKNVVYNLHFTFGFRHFK